MALGALALAAARAVRLAGGLIAALIVLAIVLRDLGANAGNTVVRAIHDAADVFAGPFTNLFAIHGARAAITVNWGIAAIAYAVAAAIVANAIVRLFGRELA